MTSVLWVQLPLFTFGVYLWCPWKVETFCFVSFISIEGCGCLKSIAIQDTGIKQVIPNGTLKPVFMMCLCLVHSSVTLLFVFYFVEILLMMCRSCIILFVWYILMVLHYHHVYSWWLTSNLYVIYRFVHDLFSYQMPLAWLE